MPHFYEKNIVDIKNEYTTFLVNIMTPFLYEGLKSVYGYALEADEQFKDKARNDPSVQSPGILKIFQTCLREIPSLNNHSIENETNRIKDKSKCSDWFDDLVKAVIKSNIVLLTFSTNKDQSELVNEKYHERTETKDFVHKCLIESARSVYNNPELFWHEYSTIEIKRNQREICELIKTSIREAIRKMLPMKLILKEYLKNEYVPETHHDVSKNMSDSHYMNVKEMVKRDLYGKGFVKQDDGLLEDDYDGKDDVVNQGGVQNLHEEVQHQNTPAVQTQPVPHDGHSHHSNKNNQDGNKPMTYDGLYKEINELHDELHDIENKMSDSDKNERNSIHKEIDNYLKHSEDGVNNSANLKEIHTDSKNGMTETDRSNFFAKYNV